MEINGKREVVLQSLNDMCDQFNAEWGRVGVYLGVAKVKFEPTREELVIENKQLEEEIRRLKEENKQLKRNIECLEDTIYFKENKIELLKHFVDDEKLKTLGFVDDEGGTE